VEAAYSQLVAAEVFEKGPPSEDLLPKLVVLEPGQVPGADERIQKRRRGIGHPHMKEGAHEESVRHGHDLIEVSIQQLRAQLRRRLQESAVLAEASLDLASSFYELRRHAFELAECLAGLLATIPPRIDAESHEYADHDHEAFPEDSGPEDSRGHVPSR